MRQPIDQAFCPDVNTAIRKTQMALRGDDVFTRSSLCRDDSQHPSVEIVRMQNVDLLANHPRP